MGLGVDDPAQNPLAVDAYPGLRTLLDGQRAVAATGRLSTAHAELIPTDATLGIPGRPQSATGQAAIVTGINAPQRLGEHYGPRPNAAVRAILDQDNLFKRAVATGLKAAAVDAYPPRFFEAIQRGKRLPSSLQHAVLSAGLRLFDEGDIYAGTGLSADWTGEGWREDLGYTDTPIYGRAEAGTLLAGLAQRRDLTLYSTWITDVVGHRGPLERGVALLELFDAVMAGLLDAWDDRRGLVIITSDHGNLEDLSTRKHTSNDVPTVIIGAARGRVAEGLRDLTGIAPGILRVLDSGE